MRSNGLRIGEDSVYQYSDKYFNDPDSRKMFEAMGIDVKPVDVYGGFVPQNKSLSNLSIAQKAIRERFNLDTD